MPKVDFIISFDDYPQAGHNHIFERHTGEYLRQEKRFNAGRNQKANKLLRAYLKLLQERVYC